MPDASEAGQQRGTGWGTVVLPFGRVFAARVDLLTRERFKTVVPIDGISPFTGVDEPDPAMQHLATGDRVNDRVRTDVRKDLAARLAGAGADVLVVDNTAALLGHRELGGRLYSVVPGEDTAWSDLLSSGADAEGDLSFKVSHRGLTDELASRYDRFVAACLDSFDPSAIILVRSHAARFRITAEGKVSVTDLDRRDADLLDVLDARFADRTGCRVSDAALSQFPVRVRWNSFDPQRLRRALEDDIVRLCAASGADAENRAPRRAGRSPGDQVAAPATGAADHVVSAAREGRAVDQDWLTRRFAAGGASFDDLLALVHLDQGRGHELDELVRTCVRLAVADERSAPSVATRQRFDRSFEALQQWPWNPIGGLRSRRPGRFAGALRGWRWGSVARPRPDGRRRRPGARVSALHGLWRALTQPGAASWWVPQVTLPCGEVVLRFSAEGCIRRLSLERVESADAVPVVEGSVLVKPPALLEVLGSWPVYLERARRGIEEAPRVVVDDVDELVDTCAWLDWSAVLDAERVVVTTTSAATVPRRPPLARTDLRFLFDPGTRVGTVGGGLADQVTHIALFDELCRPHGLELYLDDLRYTWWRSHNGFEAHRLAPDLERRRFTRLMSAELVERLRAQILATRLPWVYSQSQAWHDLGLPEALVVTWDYPNSRRLMEIGPGFDVLVYHDRAELAGLVRDPPRPVTFFTTQQRIAVAETSATAMRRVFSFRHLEATALDPEVAATAALLRSRPHVALHVRRGDYLHPSFDTGGWHARQNHYADAIDFLIGSELGTSDFDVAVFSDDLEHVEANAEEYGLRRVTGDVRFIRGHRHFDSVYDSYLMALCPVIIGSVGFFAATTSLLADPPNVFVRARPEGVRVVWRRAAGAVDPRPGQEQDLRGA